MQHSPVRTSQQSHRPKVVHSPINKSVLSPLSDKENQQQEMNLLQANTKHFQSLEMLNEVADNLKVDESIVDDTLTLFQRITHTKWQVRRKVYVQLIEEFSENQGMYEFQQAWLKHIINDNNQFAANEGIKFMETFVRSPSMNSHILPYFVGDLLERGAFMKSGSSSTIIDILLQCCKVTSDTTYILQEIQRKLDTNHPKVVTFCQQLLLRLVSAEELNSHFNKDMLKNTIRNTVQMIKNTNKKIRSQGIQIFTKLYQMIKESFDDIRKAYLDQELRQIQIKELEQLCKKVQKRQQLFKLEEGHQAVQVLDLHQFLPIKFFEIPYCKPNEKKLKVAELANNLEQYTGEIDATKDYTSIYQILITILEENNYLIYNEGMRCVRLLVKLIRKNIPQAIAKHLFTLVLDKLKASLSKQHQSVVFNILEDILLNESISCDLFMELMITQLESNNNLGIRTALVRWFKDGWLSLALAIQTGSYHQSDFTILKKFAQANSDKIQKSLLILYKKVAAIQRKENNLNFKKACMELLTCMELDEQSMQVRVLEAQLAVPDSDQQITQESRVYDTQQQIQTQPLKLLKQKQKSKTVDKNRYQTEEDQCEIAQLAEQIGNKVRLSVEWPQNLSKQQQEFMNKLQNDLVQLKKLAQNAQEMHVCSKIEEIYSVFKQHLSETEITSNDFLQEMTQSIIQELHRFTKRMQFNKKSIVDRLNEFVVTILIKINTIQITLDPELLLVQLKIILTKLSMDGSKIIQILESLYICCSIENMVRVGVRILSKYQQTQVFCSSQQLPNGKAFQLFYNWLGSKLHTTPQQQLEPSFLKLAFKSFENFQKQLSACSSLLDLKPLLSVLQTRWNISQADQLSDAYNDMMNNSNRKSKSKSFGSQSRFSPYETPDKSKTQIEFGSCEEQEPIETFQSIETALLQQCNSANLDNLIAYLNRMRAQQLTASNLQQPSIFLSPNSRSPGKKWRRGIGRENMIISTPGRSRPDNVKFEEWIKLLEYIGQNYTMQLQSQVFQIFYIIKNIYPQSLNSLVNLLFTYICTYNFNDKQDKLDAFMGSLLVGDKTTICHIYRLVFNTLYQGGDQINQDKLINLITNGFKYIYSTLVNQNVQEYLEYFVTSITYMLSLKMFHDYSNEILLHIDQNKQNNRIIETELISYKKLYDCYMNWLGEEVPTPQLKGLVSFGQNDLQKLYQANQILVVDLQEIDECFTKREDTFRDSSGDRYKHNSEHLQVHFNKEDFELLESTTKNFQTSNTLRFTEDCIQQTYQNMDLLNLHQFISPLQGHQSTQSLHTQDPIIQEITKNLYKEDHQKQQLNELEHIKQLNQSFRNTKRDSHKSKSQDDIQQPQQPQQPQQSQPLCKQGQVDIQRIYQDIQNQSINNPDNHSLLSDVLAPIEQTTLFDITKNQKRNECIKHLQEILLTSSSLYFDVATTLLQSYESLDMLEDKIAFVDDLKLSIINKTLLTNINDQNFSVIVSIILKLCTAPATQSEIYHSSLGYDENQLTKSLQLILDVLLRSKSNEQVLTTLIHVFSEHLPLDVNVEISRNEKMMLRLNLKCVERLVSNAEDLNIFPVLIEVYKFFKYHPAENLVEGLPSIKELELYFRQMKSITDQLIQLNKMQAKEFVEFIYRKNSKSIFIDYAKGAVDKLFQQ